MKTKLQLTYLTMNSTGSPNDGNFFVISGNIRMPPVNGKDLFNFSFSVHTNGNHIEKAEDVIPYIQHGFDQAREYFKEIGSEFARL